MTENSHLPEIVRPPDIVEYLPQAIQKAVISRGVRHPATLYPIGIGAGTGIAGWLLGMPLLYIFALGAMLMGPAWAVTQIFFSYEKHGSRYIRELNEQQKKYEASARYLLEKELEECAAIKGVESLAAQAVAQLSGIQEKFENVKELLNMKLHKEELTYARFMGAAEQVNLSVLDNLKDMVSLLKSAGSIHPDYIRKHLDKLAHSQTQAEMTQGTSLRDRLKLREQQLEKAGAILTGNEEAMTQMEKISAAVAEWQTDNRFTETDFESAISRLQQLASRAHEYQQEG